MVFFFLETASPTSCSINPLELCCPKEAGFKCKWLYGYGYFYYTKFKI